MPVDAECFVIHPFQELVKIAKEAAANAEADKSEDPEQSKCMLKAARGLVKEGERALQKLQPLWDAQIERHGDAFKKGIRDNGKLASFLLNRYGPLFSRRYLKADSLEDVDVENRRILEDLLYDLDDFIEVDTFNADKYAEVQAASKAFALSALEAIRRLKIENGSSTLPSSPEPHPLTALSTNTIFPPLPPLPPGKAESLLRLPSSQPPHSPPASTSTSRQDSQRTHSTRTGDRTASGGSHELERTGTRSSHASSANSSGSIRSSVSSRRSDQWRLHPNPLRPARSSFNKKRSNLGKNGRSSPAHSNANGREISPSQAEIGPKMAYMSSTSRISEWVREQVSTTLPSETEAIPEVIPEVIPEDGTLPHIHADRPDTSRANRDTLESSALPEYNSAAPTSPSSTSYRTSVFSDASSRLSTAKSSLQVPVDTSKIPPLPSRFFSVFPTSSPEIPPKNSTRLVGGVKAASRERVADVPALEPEKEPWYANRANCSIGPDSSFNLLGGFCEGAFVFREGGGQAATVAGLEQVRTAQRWSYHVDLADQVWQSNKVTVARCIECKYRHTLSEIEMDSNPKMSGGLGAWGVRYRLRFLYKSHLASDSAHVTRYGCVFCWQERRTPCESDATVFTTPDQLFRHLARHPQPLPEMGDFPVTYGETPSDDPGLGDADLVFPNPQAVNPLTEAESTSFELLPNAVAVTDHLVRPGDRQNVGPDGEKTLQFLEGARIVGIEFPEKWGGKQCVGWHDGARGSFPARCIFLLPPRKGDIRTPGMNNDGVTVTARWKWEPKDPCSGWLAFDKGATIRNVSWLDQGQWCWSGMTKDGKVGFFPQSHISPESVKEAISPESHHLRHVRPTRLFKLRRTLSHVS
ncbi:uncharacterized protein PG986_005596 [Apiospora aurea]|uniref:SH3 domain-containing protein n=1 Tax=Apiospora aurea TaxID=335848 RepID=A0ABR1QI07_9PEZI